MYKVLVMAALLALVGCGFFDAKVAAVVDTEGFKATFFEDKCSSKKVLELLPETQVKELGDKLKAGRVHIKQLNEDREFCYVLVDESLAAVIDEKGAMPLIPLNKPAVPKSGNNLSI
jgi:hypothetical protein